MASCPGSPIASLLTRFRMRSVDQKLKVSKIPVREPEQPYRVMSADRRKKLERIRANENERNRLDRIGKIILRKLSLKLGTMHKDLIKVCIDESLQPGVMITDALLSDIEAKATKDIELFFKSTIDTAVTSSVEIPTAEPQIEYTSSVVEITPPVGTEWLLLQAFDQLQAADAEIKEKELQRSKKLKFKESLDQQIRSAHDLSARHGDENKSYIEFMMRDQKLFEAAEERKREAIRRKNEEEMLARKKQAEDQLAQKQRERDQARQAEIRSNEIAMKKLQMENQRREALRKKNIELRRQVQQENEENRRRLQEKKIQEIQENNDLIRQYREREERELVEREKALHLRMSSSDQNAQRAAETHMREESERRLLEEKELMIQVNKKEAADRAQELMKEEEKRKQLEQYKWENEKLREWHRRIEEKERKESEELKLKYKQDQIENEKHVADNWRRKKEFQMQYRATLLSQMKSPDVGLHQASVDAGMEAREREMNYATLQRAVREVPAITARLQRTRPRSALAPYGDLGNSGGSIW